jgi:hypothetical protein
MRPFEVTPIGEYEPPSLCHTGLEFLAAAPLLGAGAATAGEVALASTLLAAPATAGAAISSTVLPAAALAAAPAVWTPAAAAAAGAGLTGAGVATGAGLGLGTLGEIASIAGTGIQAIGQMNQAKAAEEAAKVEAQALKQRANEEAASAQRVAATREQQARLVQSRARALGASSGTLATDVGQEDIEGDIATQGRYNALSALYEGMAAARSSNYQADIELFKGRRARAAMPMAVGGTLLSGLSSFASKRTRRGYLLDQFGSL